MSFELNDLVPGFVEDCLEHLGDIETSLMDLESVGGSQEQELVNRVFRAAHSIKGGAGMLGLDNIKALAHKLENVLHMVRSGEIPVGKQLIGVLLGGFDRLSELVGNVGESESLPIDEQVAQLELLFATSPKGSAVSLPPREIPVGGSSLFVIDPVSLDQARHGGYDIYLLEFDLIHDIHGRGSLPLDVLRTLTDTGRIVDCKLDFEAVGGLDEFENRIPFYVLFATILEQKYVASLVRLGADKVRSLAEAGEAVQVRQAECWNEEFGSVALRTEGPVGRIILSADMTGRALGQLKSALLAALSNCGDVRIEARGTVRYDALLLQLLCSAGASFRQQGKLLSIAGALSQELRQTGLTLGFGCGKAAGCVFA